MLATAIALAPGPFGREAQAQSAADVQKARSLFKKSEAMYQAGRFQDAIDLLNEAYALDPKPVLLYNIARAYESLGDTPRAIDFYRKYLDKDPAAPDRGALEQRIATFERQEQERAALVKQRDEAARAEAERARESPAETKPAPPPPSSPSPIPWVIAGVGVAGVGAGVVLGLVARGRHDDAVADPDADSAVDTQAQAEHLATGATIAFIAGGAVAAGGILWGILDVSASRSTRVGFAPRAIVLSGRF